MKLTVIIVFAILLSTSAHARLGETAAEIAARYGSPVKLQVESEGLFGLATTNYVFKDFEVTVCFKNNRSIHEVLKPKTDRMMPDECFEMVKAIGGGTWEESLVGKLWKRADGAVAVYSSSGGLYVSSPEMEKHRKRYYEEQDKKRAAEAKKKAEGF